MSYSSVCGGKGKKMTLISLGILKEDPVWVLFPGSDGTKELILTMLFLFVMFWLVLISRRCSIPLFVIYILTLLYFTMMCRTFSDNRKLLNGLFDTIRNSLSMEGGLHITDRVTFNAMLLNILLFAPMGYLLPTIFKLFTKVWFMIPMGLIISLIIETTQYFTGLGVFDVDDLFFNTLGTALGFLLFRLLVILERKREKRRKNIELNGNSL